MRRSVVVAAVLSGLVFFLLGGLIGFRWSTSSPAENTPASASVADRRDFMFQVNGFKTNNQGGQTINLYFHYRYADGIAEDDIPNYEDLRKKALTYLTHIDAAANPYWETLAKTMCTELKANFPIEAISCQMQVFPDNRPGLPYEPGYHGTIYTIGNIEALALPGPISQQQCPDGADWRTIRNQNRTGCASICRHHGLKVV